jgi:hypothetical protein
MHHFVAYELHRQWLAQYEREAELRRALPARGRRPSLVTRLLRGSPQTVPRALFRARTCV